MPVAVATQNSRTTVLSMVMCEYTGGELGSDSTFELGSDPNLAGRRFSRCDQGPCQSPAAAVKMPRGVDLRRANVYHY